MHPDLANLTWYRDTLTRANKKMFFSLGVTDKSWMHDTYGDIPPGTFIWESWINDIEARTFFMQLVRDMGHGYVQANAGKPINWYNHSIYKSDKCQDLLDPAKNAFSTFKLGRGYDTDGVFEYGQGDALSDSEFKFHSLGYNGDWMSPLIWEYYIQRDGTLRYHFRDFIDFVGDSFPRGTITIVELFNELRDCNGREAVSSFLDAGVGGCTSLYYSQYINVQDDDANQCLDSRQLPVLTANKWDYFDILALPSERDSDDRLTKPTKASKAQIWCELALRARAKWGFPAVAYNDYGLFEDEGGENVVRFDYLKDATKAIATASLTEEQRRSLIGVYENPHAPQCIDAIDVIGSQSHTSCNKIGYTSSGINDFIDKRVLRIRDLAHSLSDQGIQKVLEVHITEVDFQDCIQSPRYTYTVDSSTGRPVPAADGRSLYQDPVDSDKYSKFYALAHAVFTSCWHSPYCTMLGHWGVWGVLRDSNRPPPAPPQEAHVIGRVAFEHAHSQYTHSLHGRCMEMGATRINGLQQRPLHALRSEHEANGCILRSQRLDRW